MLIIALEISIIIILAFYNQNPPNDCNIKGKKNTHYDNVYHQ